MKLDEMSSPYNYLHSIFSSSSLSSSTPTSYVPLRHVSQTEQWDCGVACICMILLWINKYTSSSPSLQDLKLNHNWNKPLWTIEIFYFLKNYGVEVTYFTKFLGVGQHHSNMDWYTEHLDEDTKRVETLLLATQENNWPIIQRILTLSEFLDYLNKSTVAIVLVDIHLLSSLTSCVATDGDNYVGHYIVVIGYQNDTIAYLDPALSSDIQWMPFHIFDAVRKSLGTDEDILICHNMTVSNSTISSIPNLLCNLTKNGEILFNTFLSFIFNVNRQNTEEAYFHRRS